MPTHKQRSRIVSFRLSEEEYDSLLSATETCGARSVSEFTRSVACANKESANREINVLEEILRGINERMDAIQQEIRELARIDEEKKNIKPQHSA